MVKAGATLWLTQKAMVARAKELVVNERGEVASWLIMAAGLVAAAVAAVVIVGGFITDRANDINSTEVPDFGG